MLSRNPIHGTHVMNEKFRAFLHETGPVLCLDIGAATQKALFARPAQEISNWPRFVFPAPALWLSQRIRELTILRKGLWLYGHEIGDGFVQSVREHLAAGLPVSCTASAARSILSNPEQVQGLGIKIAEICPTGYIPVHVTDFSPGFWEDLLRLSCLPQPHMILAAAHDHGGNGSAAQKARMERFAEQLSTNPNPSDWLYSKAPNELGRLKSLQENTGGPVADSSVCAILGALCDPEVMERSFREGITVINIGNIHTTAALVYHGHIVGLYEHHTDNMSADLLLDDLDEFRRHWLVPEKVVNAGGHGVVFGVHNDAAGDFKPTFILGARGYMLAGHGKLVAPCGDMPHAGCFGILYGWVSRHNHIRNPG